MMLLNYIKKNLFFLSLTVLVTFSITFLSFALIRNYIINKATSYVNKEAILYDELYRLTYSLSGDVKLKMQQKTLDYIQSVIDEEWPNFCKNDNYSTPKKLNEIYEFYYNYLVGKAKDEEFLRSSVYNLIPRIKQARYERINYCCTFHVKPKPGIFENIHERNKNFHV